MKRAIIGGFLSLIGSIWLLAIIVLVGNNLTSSWPQFPGRFLTSVGELGMAFPMLLSAVLLLVGILVMMIEYFKKER